MNRILSFILFFFFAVLLSSILVFVFEIEETFISYFMIFSGAIFTSNSMNSIKYNSLNDSIDKLQKSIDKLNGKKNR